MKIEDIKLIKGKGNYTENTACVMSLAVLIDRLNKGKDIGKATDELDCICPVIRALAIARNDGYWESDDQRTAWGHNLAHRLLNTKVPIHKTIDRAFKCADMVVRKVIKLKVEPIHNHKTASAALLAAADASNSATVAAYAYYVAAYASYYAYAYYAYDASYDTYTAAHDAAVYASASAAISIRANALHYIDELIEEFINESHLK